MLGAYEWRKTNNYALLQNLSRLANKSPEIFKNCEAGLRTRVLKKLWLNEPARTAQACSDTTDSSLARSLPIDK